MKKLIVSLGVAALLLVGGLTVDSVNTGSDHLLADPQLGDLD
ncbi:hypothetical protein [Lentibacillus sp. CBA3610]|nr:hypothetical protein [Lentibacillus sp. CBA3610]